MNNQKTNKDKKAKIGGKIKFNDRIHSYPELEKEVIKLINNN